MLQQVISRMQYAIFYDRLRSASTYEVLMKHYNLSRNALIHCFTRTAEGRFWDKGMPGGGQTYLSNIDMLKFASMASEAANDLNCLSTPCAVSLAMELKRRRLEKARYLLKKMNLERLIEHLPQYIGYPSKAWIKDFASSLDLHVVNSQTLEHVRRTSCDVGNILAFFEEFSIVMDRHPAMIFNMDETMLNGKRKYKVLARENRLPLTDTTQAYPHLTGIVTVSAIGRCLDPMIIIPNKKTTKSLDFPEVRMVSSTSGWITKKIFLFYCIDLISQLQIYRLSLPSSIRTDPFLLIVDGHSSRGCFYACYLLALFNIDLLILPPHSSHVVQPFDVSIASPLKTEFTKNLQKRNLIIDLNNFTLEQALKITAAQTREQLIDSFLSALRTVTSRSNISDGFKKSGIYPLDPSIPLNSEFILPTALNPTKPNYISNKFLNTEDELLKLFKFEYKRDYNAEKDQITNLQAFINDQWNNIKIDDRTLYELPPIIISDDAHLLFRLT